MKIDFDPAKSKKNALERGLPFELIEAFEWASALLVEDERKRYAERRFQALGYIADRLHMMVFTPTPGGIRVISLRKANTREVRRHEKAQDHP